ncbi:MAG: sigma-70 family RNA polymerase sigma factor [Gammaproteobacteria bacterium]|nr:sigma-70 family RNA polymerase sigma factor [Gammaproteobacteria bacterium]
MTPVDELATLLARCAQRDRAALKPLYRLTAPQLFAIALRILKVSHRAEEALQDGFMRIWQHAADYRPERAPPMAWMATVVRYQALDLRPHDAIIDVIRPPSMDSDIDHPSGPLPHTERQHRAQGLQRCLERLDAKQRQTIQLAFYQGLTHSALAVHLNEKLGPVKSRVRRGLDRLKICFDE